jgi:5'-nucleotidase
MSLAALAGCSSTTTSSTTPTTASGSPAVPATAGTAGTTPGSTPGTAPGAAAGGTLHILVTNDDGYNAPGIDAVVTGLRTLPDVEVTVVAPADNQSGTGGQTTPGTLVTTTGTTLSGYPAVAVHGHPADTITWAIDQHGVSQRPDLVVSGINFGQNLGPTVNISGTVGAARAAVAHGIPALAVSQGAGAQPDWAAGVLRTLDWVRGNRDAVLSHSGTPTVWNLNVPTCSTGRVRGEATTVTATDVAGRDMLTANCQSTKTTFTDDIDAFINGYAALAPAPAS